MANSKERKLQIVPTRFVREYRVINPTLFGLIKIEKIESTTTFGEQLNIFIDREPEKIYINRQEWINKISLNEQTKVENKLIKKDKKETK